MQITGNKPKPIYFQVVDTQRSDFAEKVGLSSDLLEDNVFTLNKEGYKNLKTHVGDDAISVQREPGDGICHQ